jgi:hypothetical protein
MQVCQLTGAEADRVEHSGFVPDCHFHGHLSKGDAHQLAESAGEAYGKRRTQESSQGSGVLRLPTLTDGARVGCS